MVFGFGRLVFWGIKKSLTWSVDLTGLIAQPELIQSVSPPLCLTRAPFPAQKNSHHFYYYQKHCICWLIKLFCTNAQPPKPHIKLVKLVLSFERNEKEK